MPFKPWEYRLCEPSDQQADWQKRPWYIRTCIGEWFCMLCGSYANIQHLQCDKHKRRLRGALQISEPMWIRENEWYIREYVQKYKPQESPLDGLEAAHTTREAYHLQRQTPASCPAPPPGPPPLFFVTVPVESTQFAEYKRLLYEQGVVDCNGNLLLSSMAARSLHADAAQYRFDIGCTLSALACVKGYPHFNYMGADVGEEFQLLHMGEKPEDRDWLWVSNKSNQAGWISRAVVGKRGLAYYPWHAGATWDRAGSR